MKERLLLEIDRRLASAAFVCTKCGWTGDRGDHQKATMCGYLALDARFDEKQALRALRREIERHSMVTLRETKAELSSTCCDSCNFEPWPCPTITDSAAALGVR